MIQLWLLSASPIKARILYTLPLVKPLYKSRCHPKSNLSTQWQPKSISLHCWRLTQMTLFYWSAQVKDSCLENYLLRKSWSKITQSSPTQSTALNSFLMICLLLVLVQPFKSGKQAPNLWKILFTFLNKALRTQFTSYPVNLPAKAASTWWLAPKNLLISTVLTLKSNKLQTLRQFKLFLRYVSAQALISSTALKSKVTRVLLLSMVACLTLSKLSLKLKRASKIWKCPVLRRLKRKKHLEMKDTRLLVLILIKEAPFCPLVCNLIN